MKIKKLFGYIEIHWSFILWRTKTLKISIPDNADDCHYRSEIRKIMYFQKGKKQTIDLPQHDKAEQLFRSPLHDPNTKTYATNRIIIVKLFKQITWRK